MILLNDRLLPEREVSISPDDRGYYFGDGVYEMFRVYGGALFETEAHMRRLERSATATRIALPYAADALRDKLQRLVAAEGIADGTVYVQVTRGAAPRAHAFPAQTPPMLYANAKEAARPLAAMESGITAVTVPDIRWLRCDLKTLNLLPNVLAKQEALDRGADEAILHRDGVVTECSASNVMIVEDGVVLTHPANHLILHGVTRAVVIALLGEIGVPFAEEPFDLTRLADADEVFVTGTTVEVTPIVAIDGRPVADGKRGTVTARLQQAFGRRIGR